MFHKSRKKIILSIMLPLIVLFALTLTVILLASYREIRVKNAEMLDRFVQNDRNEPQALPEPPPRPGNRPEDAPFEERRDFQLATFYAVTLAEDGSVLSVDNGEKDVYPEEELIRTARNLLAAGKVSGKTGSLFYRVSQKEGGTLIAFLDNTVTESGMQTLLRNVLLVGGIAIAVLFLLSLYLSGRIIRPLEENDRRQKQFISDASHELKTPVSVISASAELLSRELGENEWLSNIQYENRRMGELVGQLLELSRAERTQITTERLDLSRIVAGEALALESVAFDRGRTIRTEIAENVHVTGNRSQLTQLVSILLDNAIRHSTGTEITVSLSRHGRTAELCVANPGPEIPPSQQARLFDRFYRLDEARNGESQHYGLGLAIAKAITEQHGGSIGVACMDGTVRFTVLLSEKAG